MLQLSADDFSDFRVSPAGDLRVDFVSAIYACLGTRKCSQPPIASRLDSVHSEDTSAVGVNDFEVDIS